MLDRKQCSNVRLITQPLLMMMAKSEADTLYMTKDSFELTSGTEEKALFLVEGTPHIQTYSISEYGKQETTKILELFWKAFLSRTCQSEN